MAISLSWKVSCPAPRNRQQLLPGDLKIYDAIGSAVGFVEMARPHLT